MTRSDIRRQNVQNHFRSILRESPADNPPYLTHTGHFFLITICAAAVFAFYALYCDYIDFCTFLASSVAFCAAAAAVDYAVLLMTWRALRTRHLNMRGAIGKQRAICGDTLKIECHVENGLRWPVRFEACAWDTTAQLDPGDILTDIRIPPQKRAAFEFSVRTRDIGPAAIIGAAVLPVSPLRLFRAEYHIEMNIPVDIEPDYSETPDDLPARIAKTADISHDRTAARPGIGETDGLRLFQNGDAIRRIAWRGYAKYGELIVRKEQTPADTPCIVCLLDAGPHMRQPAKNAEFRCALSEAVRIIVQTSGAFKTTTVIAYDESSARVLANDRTAPDITRLMTEWLIRAIAWRPPKAIRTPSDVDAETAERMQRDFKRYRHVDFSRPRGKIDIAALAAWARADRASAALKSGQPQKAAQIMKMTPQEILTCLTAERRCWPAKKLPADDPAAVPARAVSFFLKAMKNTPYATVLWFSDFTSRIDSGTLQKINGTIDKHTPAFAILMPPPVHAIHYIHSRGMVSLEANRQKLTDFRWLSPKLEK